MEAGFTQSFLKVVWDFSFPSFLGQLLCWVTFCRVDKKGRAFKWDTNSEHAFAQLRPRLATDPVLDYPDPKRAFTLNTEGIWK